MNKKPIEEDDGWLPISIVPFGEEVLLHTPFEVGGASRLRTIGMILPGNHGHGCTKWRHLPPVPKPSPVVKPVNVRTEQVIDVADWDKCVQETYGRHYRFQQQEGCRDRGRFKLTVPAFAKDIEDDPETLGVSFRAWLNSDPDKAAMQSTFQNQQLCRARVFYPDLQMVANDLYAKGLLAAGDYFINIDW